MSSKQFQIETKREGSLLQVKQEQKGNTIRSYIQNSKQILRQLNDLEQQVITKIVQNTYLINPMMLLYDPTREYYHQSMQWQAYFQFQNHTLQKQQELIKQFKTVIEEIELQASKIKCLARKYVHKKNRRIATQIERSFGCPYQNCFKSYGSDVSLNLHIKIKHNGGNKTQRQKMALQICESQLTGQMLPKCDIIFPPGYIQKYKRDFINKYKVLRVQ